jgi:hypothetical protein
MSLEEYGDRNVTFTPQSIYEASTVKNHRLGSRLSLGGGNVYHYAYAMEAITQGNLCSWEEAAVAIAATKFDITAIGATTVDADATAAAGIAEDGFLVITDGTALADSYEVRTNTAGTAGTTDTLIYIRRPLVTALSESSVGILYASPFRVQVYNAANPPAECIMGGAELDVASGSYFWMKTWGLFATIASATGWVAGGLVQGGDATDGTGQIPVAGEAGVSIAGQGITATTSALAGAIFLQCVA